jgi:hypothetical protein
MAYTQARKGGYNKGGSDKGSNSKFKYERLFRLRKNDFGSFTGVNDYVREAAQKIIDAPEGAMLTTKEYRDDETGQVDLVFSIKTEA